MLETYESNRALYVVVAAERIKMSLEQAKAALISVQKENVPGFNMIDETRIQVSERPAYRLVFTGDIEGMKIQYQMVVVVNEGIIFRILAWTMEENYEALEEAAQPLIEGFELLK